MTFEEQKRPTTSKCMRRGNQEKIKVVDDEKNQVQIKGLTLEQYVQMNYQLTKPFKQKIITRSKQHYISQQNFRISKKKILCSNSIRVNQKVYNENQLKKVIQNHIQDCKIKGVKVREKQKNDKKNKKKLHPPFQNKWQQQYKL